LRSAFVKASASENSELFWGARGGGGNFGIVTEFEFRLNPVGRTVLAGPIFWPIGEAPNVLRFYREWISEAPDELMTIVTSRKAPPLPFVPRELGGRGLRRRAGVGQELLVSPRALPHERLCKLPDGGG
jgi:FAD/FMN-containing dehydrogenase